MSKEAKTQEVPNDKYQKYLSAYNDYYTLKKNYFAKYESKKKKILKSKETIENKKLLIQALKQKRKCIKCRKTGGTNFIEEDNVLKAICNANEKKCNLNIEINKSISIYIPDYLEAEKERQKNIKREITQYKLDLLFGLENEDVVLQEFKNLRAQFTESTNTLSMLNEEYEEENKMIRVKYEKIGDIEIFLWLRNNNTELELINLNELTEKKIDDLIITRGVKIKRHYINKVQYIEYLTTGLNKILSLYKENINNYNKTENNGILIDSLEIYKTKIMPITSLIRLIKYPITFVEKINNSTGFSKNLMPTFHVHSNNISIQNEIFESDYKVIANKK